MQNKVKSASKATLLRLPRYLRYLKEQQSNGVVNVSSTMVAEGLNLNAVQVRKDLALVSSVAGKPKLGFVVSELIEDINSFLGYDNTTDAVIVGVGGLGSALLGYGGFKNYGLNIVMAFDSNSALIGKKINSVTVYNADEITEEVQKSNVKIGIVCVPKAAAQDVAEKLISGGVRAIWNFAPTHLNLPETVAVKNEDMAASLAILSKRLEQIL